MGLLSSSKKTNVSNVTEQTDNRIAASDAATVIRVEGGSTLNFEPPSGTGGGAAGSEGAVGDLLRLTEQQFQAAADRAGLAGGNGSLLLVLALGLGVLFIMKGKG